MGARARRMCAGVVVAVALAGCSGEEGSVTPQVSDQAATPTPTPSQQTPRQEKETEVFPTEQSPA